MRNPEASLSERRDDARRGIAESFAERADEISDGAAAVKDALEYARGVMRGFDPDVLDVKFSQDQREYLATHPDVLLETASAARKIIEPKLAEIKREESGCLRRLNEKLGRLRGLFGALALTSALSASAGNFDDTAVGESPESSGPVVAVKSDADHYRSIREKVGLYRSIEKRIRGGDFRNESELLDFMRMAAETYDGELYAMYGMDASGRMQFYDGHSSLMTSSVEALPISVVRELRENGEYEMRDVHTHPTEVTDSPGSAARNIPPSLADIRGSEIHAWLDRFDNPTVIDASSLSAVHIRHFVVTSDGVWEYGADHSNAYMKEQRVAAVERALSTLHFREDGVSERYGISEKDAREFFTIMQTPDTIVLDRETKYLKDKGVDVSGLEKSRAIREALFGGTSVDNGRGEGEFEWTTEQMKVVKALPGEEPAAVAEFIRFCEDRGITMKYTPFPGR